MEEKPILYVYNLWWAFGGHLLNIKWAMIHSVKNNYHFYYKDNRNQIFINNRIDTYFENISSIDEEYLQKHDIKYGDCILYNDSTYKLNIKEQFSFKPDAFETIEEFHQSLLQKIYKPNQFVKNYIDSNELIICLRSNKIKYIGLHIRLSDKVNGPSKESEFIDLKYYLDECLFLRDKYDINNIVICSDTDFGIETIKELNKKLKRKFNLYYNIEPRADNDWKKSASYIISTTPLDKEMLIKEYLTCFINFQLLLEADVLVGNYDSGFLLSAVEYRNNGIDVNVNKINPPLWGIKGIEKKWNESNM